MNSFFNVKKILDKREIVKICKNMVHVFRKLYYNNIIKVGKTCKLNKEEE